MHIHVYIHMIYIHIYMHKKGHSVWDVSGEGKTPTHKSWCKKSYEVIYPFLPSSPYVYIEYPSHLSYGCLQNINTKYACKGGRENYWQSLQWRHNERDGVSYHQRLDCLHNLCSGKDQRKHQRGIHRWPMNSPHKGPVTRKCFHLMTSSWSASFCWIHYVWNAALLIILVGANATKWYKVTSFGTKILHWEIAFAQKPQHFVNLAYKDSLCKNFLMRWYSL